MRNTDPKVDPYGWSLLQRFGLAGSFCLRLPDTGEPLAPDATQQRLEAALNGLQADDPLRRHLSVEILFRQARATRVKSDEPTAGDAGEAADRQGDLLAVVQLSLRPVFDWYAVYSRSARPIEFDPPGLPVKPEVPPTTGKLVLTKAPDVALTVILQSEGDQQQYNVDPGGAAWEKAFTVPANKALCVLLQASRTTDVPPPSPTAVLRWDGRQPDGTTFPEQPHPLVAFAPTEWDATYFAADPATLPNWRKAARDAWRVDQDNVPDKSLNRYLRSLDPGGGTVLPALGDQNASPAWPLILLWLNRFFEHGGTEIDAGGQPGLATGPGWWTATAYPRRHPSAGGAGPALRAARIRPSDRRSLRPRLSLLCAAGRALRPALAGRSRLTLDPLWTGRPAPARSHPPEPHQPAHGAAADAGRLRRGTGPHPPGLAADRPVHGPARPGPGRQRRPCPVRCGRW